MSTEYRHPTRTGRDPHLAGAEAAMHRAARRARDRANQAAAPGRPSEPTASPTRAVQTAQAVGDPRSLSFSQAYGYEEVPRPLKLEELPDEARTAIWSLFYSYIQNSRLRDWLHGTSQFIGIPWSEIMRAKHLKFDLQPLDEWDSRAERVYKELKDAINELPFNKVFDLIEFVLRHPRCPPKFIKAMKSTFAEYRLAYTIDIGPPPTIIPAATPNEGAALVDSLQTLRQAGLDASAEHLRRASESINVRDWAGSVRESIHAVESVARRLDPGAAKTLRPALEALARRGTLHPALKQAFSGLYGYTSDEQGVRHALLDRTDARVGQDDALFMLGACASFASYLWRRHAAGESG